MEVFVSIRLLWNTCGSIFENIRLFRRIAHTCVKLTRALTLAARNCSPSAKLLCDTYVDTNIHAYIFTKSYALQRDLCTRGNRRIQTKEDLQQSFSASTNIGI